MVVATKTEREVWLDPRELQANPWNPNTMDDFMWRKTLMSIETLGFSSPAVVRDKGDYFEVIDGEHRVKAAIELDLPLIPVWNLGVISDSHAKQLTVVLNETRGQADRERLGELLRDLLSSEATADLLKVLPFEQTDFEALLNVPDFNWDDIEKLTQDNTKTDRMRWVERIYRMPPEVAEVIDRAIAKVRESEEDQDKIEDWRALELICADWLAR
jgi:hypothetical protein